MSDRVNIGNVDGDYYYRMEILFERAQIAGYHVNGNVHSVLFRDKDTLRAVEFAVCEDGESRMHDRHDVLSVKESVLISRGAR